MPEVVFGAGRIPFDPAPGDTLTEREPADIATGWNPQEFKQALDTAHFDRCLAYGRPLVVVNDAFRPTPTGYILSLISEYYPEFKADFVIACGNHPAPGPNEIKSIFSRYELPSDSNVYSHNSRDMTLMAAAGTWNGNTLYINRRIFDYPAVIVIGSVEPHYFAGYTGGRKSLVPGLSDIESNRRNHALAVSEHARPLRLKGNPVAENLEELLSLIEIPTLFSIQAVTGRKQQLLGCFVGELRSSFEEAVFLAKLVYSFHPGKQYDLVVAEMREPLDRNLYQLQKGIENCAAAVRNGGALVAVSKCEEGIGNDEFYRLAKKLQTKEAVCSHAVVHDPPLGIHKLSRIVHMSRRIRVKALTGLAPDILKQVFIEPAVSLNNEIRCLREEKEGPVDILLVRDAGVVVADMD